MPPGQPILICDVTGGGGATGGGADGWSPALISRVIGLGRDVGTGRQMPEEGLPVSGLAAAFEHGGAGQDKLTRIFDQAD